MLKKNGLSPARYMNEFIELNKGKMGKDNSLFAGQTYRLPIPRQTTVAPAQRGDSAKVDSIAQPAPEKTGKQPAAASGSKAATAANSKSPSTTTVSAPAKGQVIVNPLYGKKYEKVTVIDQSLKGAIFYLKSGHGGPDPGAIGKWGNYQLCEDEYAYDVTLRLSRALEERGAKVYMIVRDKNDGIRDDSILKPDKDEVCYPDSPIPLNQLARLTQRKDAVNRLYTANKGQHQRLIIIHVDSRSKGENIDVFFYHDQRSNSGKKMAMNLQQTFKEKYDYYQPARGYRGSVSARNLFVLKYSYPTATFIELGNINHSRDQQRFMIPKNRQAIASWLCDGLMKDFKNNPE